MPAKVILLMLLLGACSMVEKPSSPYVPKEFSQGEVVLATQLLTKIFDQEMAPLTCVPDTDEASLLLRTIHPRMELIQDDLEAMLDEEKHVQELITSCEKNCTCHYLDDLLREHLVVLNKGLRSELEKKKKQKDLNSCLNYIKETFCESELYHELNKEKSDFSYEE